MSPYRISEDGIICEVIEYFDSFVISFPKNDIPKFRIMKETLNFRFSEMKIKEEIEAWAIKNIYCKITIKSEKQNI